MLKSISTQSSSRDDDNSKQGGRGPIGPGSLGLRRGGSRASKAGPAATTGSGTVNVASIRKNVPRCMYCCCRHRTGRNNRPYGPAVIVGRASNLPAIGIDDDGEENLGDGEGSGKAGRQKRSGGTCGSSGSGGDTSGNDGPAVKNATTAEKSVKSVSSYDNTLSMLSSASPSNSGGSAAGDAGPPECSQSFSDLLRTYLEHTSAHALPRVATSRSRVRRVLWILTFLFFVSYFVYQLGALLSMFYSYPVGATIFIEQRSVLFF